MEKIVFALPNMALGGTEKSLLSLLDTLSEDDYDVTILLFRKEGELLDQIPDWVKVKELSEYELIMRDFNESPFKLAPEYLKQKRPIRAFNILFRHIVFRLTKNRYSYFKYVLKNFNYTEPFDIAVAYLGPYDLLTAYVLFCINAKEKIQWIHFDVSKYVFNKNTSGSLYKNYDKINVVSEGARNSLICILPEYKNKTYYVRNKISEKRLKEMAMLGSGFEDNFSGTRIITVGRLSEEKGQDIIPEIANMLKDKGYDFRWYIIGEGDLSQTIKNNITKYQVEDFVVLLGARKNPYPFYNEADIYVQTSVHEGFCLTIAEAKAFDMPIISTEFEGAHEQLDGRENCYIVNRDANLIFDSILKIKNKSFER